MNLLEAGDCGPVSWEGGWWMGWGRWCEIVGAAFLFYSLDELFVCVVACLFFFFNSCVFFSSYVSAR